MKKINERWLFEKADTTVMVDLPHDAMLHEKRDAVSPGGVNSGFFMGGKYTYSKTLMLSKEDCSKGVSIFFEGVYRNSAVYVNDMLAGGCDYGYSEFTVDITPFVHPDANEIRVTADNSLIPNCRWYSGAGIFRNVWFCVGELKPPRIETKSYDPAVISITGATEIEIFDGETLIAKGGAGEYNIPNATLWSAETPHLYTCVANGHSIRFGIRKIEWSSKTGFLVNGNRVLLRGGCIHHDNGVLGACSYTGAEYRRVKILKDQGFNAIRISHNSASRALLDACDELGMYVMDECFDGWYIPKDYHDYSRQFMQNYRNDLKSMVEKDYNHPSVVLYSIGNEVTETTEEKGIELAAEMRDLIHFLDATRPVTCGINVLLNVYTKLGIGVYKDKGPYKKEQFPKAKRYREKKTGSSFFNAMAGKLGGLMFFLSEGILAEKLTAKFAPAVDILGLNYASSRYDRDAKKYPDRMMVGTETMVKDLPYNWARVQKYKQLIGDFVWAAWDYLGEACIGDWTYHSYKGLPLLAGQGMIDITGKPLASMAFIQTVWGYRKKPFIAVSPLNHNGETPSKGAWQFTNAIDSWTWHGYEGKMAKVEVFSDATFIRLELNGKTVGTRKLKNFRTTFHVIYKPGTLTAIALDENYQTLSHHSLTTGGKEIMLTARAERYETLVYIPLEFTDENGNLLPYIERPVTVKVEGGKLMGLGSALCKTDEKYTDETFTSYRGRLLAVVQVENYARVTATSGDVRKEIEVS